MAADTNPIALPLVLSILFAIISFPIGLYAAIARSSAVRPFLFTLSFGLLAAAIWRLVEAAWYEKRIGEIGDELAAVKPDRCPDYWEEGYSRCHGVQCKPEFAEAGGKVVWSEGGTIRLKDYQAMSADGLCSMNRQYPWMQLSNQCSARQKIV